MLSYSKALIKTLRYLVYIAPDHGFSFSLVFFKHYEYFKKTGLPYPVPLIYGHELFAKHSIIKSYSQWIYNTLFNIVHLVHFVSVKPGGKTVTCRFLCSYEACYYSTRSTIHGLATTARVERFH